MEYTLTWLKTQWVHKKFRILVALMLAVTIFFGIEFYLFQYGLFKILRYFILLWALLLIAWIDQASKRIPNQILLFLLSVRSVILVLECIVYQNYWISIIVSAFMGCILGGGMFLLCYLLTRGGIGAGDVKLLAVLGYYLGIGAIFTTLFLTVLAAAIYSMVALLLRKIQLKQEIPFAPFILAGTVMSMMLGV